LKRYERESFLKSFLLFFTTLLILNSVIFYLYFREQKISLHVEIFNKIKLYNYNFKDNSIKIDIVPIKKRDEMYILHITKDKIFAYFDIPNSKKSSLEIIYPYKKYLNSLEEIRKNSLFYYAISSFILLILSIIFSIYAINPLKKALYLLDEFLKDIIHDLNTPISSIFLNLKILKQTDSVEAIKRVEYSTKKIGSLYGNLEAIISNNPLTKEEVDIEDLILQKIEYYKYLYPSINFIINIQTKTIYTSQDGIERILDNLISNACKYNRENGKVNITIDEDKLSIEDTGIGIKNPKKVFNRYYKETQRGIGLGLNIVKKLCNKLGYKIEINSIYGIGTKFEVTLR